MNDLQGIFAIIAVLAILALALAAILMPIFVFLICGHCERMRKTLADMEHLMRHGK